MLYLGVFLYIFTVLGILNLRTYMIVFISFRKIFIHYIFMYFFYPLTSLFNEVAMTHNRFVVITLNSEHNTDNKKLKNLNFGPKRNECKVVGQRKCGC